MRLLETSSRLATSAIRVPAKPRSITTWQVVSRISLRRSATVGFFTGSNAIAARNLRLATSSGVGGWCVRIEDAGETGWVHTDGQLFEDAHALFAGSVGRGVRRVAQCLHVQVHATARLVDRQGDPLPADHGLALPHAMAELRMSVAETTHQELLTRFESDSVVLAVAVHEHVPEVLCPARARPPFDAVVDRSHHLRSAAIDASDRAHLVPSPSVAEVVGVQMSRQARKVDRCPQPEELRLGDRRTTGRRLTNRANTPGAIARAPNGVGTDGVTVFVDFDPATPRAELSEAGVVEERANARAPQVVRLLDRRRPGSERQLGAQAVLGGIDRHSNRVHRLD